MNESKYETTRWSSCVYTHKPTVNQLYGSEKHNCRKCAICLGKLTYNIWFETFSLDGWIEQKEDYYEYKDICYQPIPIERIEEEIKEGTKKVKELRNKVKTITWI